MMPGTLLEELKGLGYVLSVEGDRIRFEYHGQGDPPEDQVKPLLARLGERKADVIAIMQGRERQGRTDCFSEPLVCGACGSRNFWISIHGAKVCPVCHPPAHPTIVKTWTVEPLNLGRAERWKAHNNHNISGR